MRGLRPIERFIAEHRLHNCVPVDVQIIGDLWDVRIVQLDEGLQGMAVWSGKVGAIAVSADLDELARRAALCHEAGHIILDHPNSLYLCRLNEWLHSRYEREAQQAAAMILLPRAAVLQAAVDGATPTEMAGLFRVPLGLVEMRLEMMANG